MFILSSRNNQCQSVSGHFGISTEVSPDISGLGPKCPNQFGISVVVSPATSALVLKCFGPKCPVTKQTSAFCSCKFVFKKPANPKI